MINKNGGAIMLLTLKRKNRKGFTLIELIVVVAILAILAAIAIPSFIGLQEKAAEGVAIADASAIAGSINVWNAMHPEAKITTKPATFADFSTAVGTDLTPTIAAANQAAAIARLRVSTDGVATVDAVITK